MKTCSYCGGIMPPDHCPECRKLMSPEKIMYLTLIPGVRLPIVSSAMSAEAAAEDAAGSQGLSFLPPGSRVLEITDTTEVLRR